MAVQRMSRMSALLLAVMPCIALAVLVSAADIVKAIQSSPTANAWLRQNAAAVANLALNVESRGETTAFNGSCCYGILQMNQANIARYAGVSPEQYRQQSLQQQINAWTALTSDALQSRVVQDLLALGTFDGRPVDGNLVLACVQLGIGNCRQMLNSGRCAGFADSNGTTICSMADRAAGRAPGGGTGGGGTTTPGGDGSGSGGGWKPTLDACVKDAGGRCLPVAEAIQQGFVRGSGQSMGNVKRLVLTLGFATCLVIIAVAITGVWHRFSSGQLTSAQLKRYVFQGGITLSIVLMALALL